MLRNKNVLLGVSGSIAAYKAATLTRLLIKAGAFVKIVMTKDAASFITPLTLATLSKNPVSIEYFKKDTGEWNNHVDLGLWADLLIVAPIGANTLAKFSNGLCDNLLSAVYLSAKCPVYLAPAMDLDMLQHPATIENLRKLKEYGNIIIQPGFGELASGLLGEGRMAEPEDIIAFLEKQLSKTLPLTGKKALVTAGPTYETIDPVRFIGNYSSGKMGFAIAEELSKLGASVTLISGPVSINIANDFVKRIDVTSSHEMLIAVENNIAYQDIIVMSAAVADYRIENPYQTKIKKTNLNLTLQLTKTTDILNYIGKQKKEGQILVGFALETDNEEENAIAKLKAKNLDFIVLNSLQDKGAGFKGDTNKITIIDIQLNKESFETKLKTDVAADICQKIISLI